MKQRTTNMNYNNYNNLQKKKKLNTNKYFCFKMVFEYTQNI